MTDAGVIVDFATEQSAAMLRDEIYGDAATTQAQDRHLRTINLATIDDTREYVGNFLSAADDHRRWLTTLAG